MAASLPIACVALALTPGHETSLGAVCSMVRPSPAGSQQALYAALAEAEGLLCSNQIPVDAALFDSAPRLRVVSGFGVGYNNVDVDEATRRGIAVCNTPGVLTDAVADLTLGLIIAASRHLVANARFAADGGWARREPAPGLGWDLTGKTLGLIGFGRIGRATATRARAFGMRVVYHDLFSNAGPDWDWCTSLSLDALLAQADIVSLHTNLTDESFHLIGARELSLMTPTAWLVNTSRGPVIDQPALTEALRSSRIAGAALDVLEVEPPPAGEPILSLPNIIIVPHIGSATSETRAAMLDLAVRNLSAVLRGEPPPECVNPEVLGRALKRQE